MDILIKNIKVFLETFRHEICEGITYRNERHPKGQVMTANFFSNRDPDLPNLNLKSLPKIKSALPNIKMQGESDWLFDTEGANSLDDVAEKFSTIYFNS